MVMLWYFGEGGWLPVVVCCCCCFGRKDDDEMGIRSWGIWLKLDFRASTSFHHLLGWAGFKRGISGCFDIGYTISVKQLCPFHLSMFSMFSIHILPAPSLSTLYIRTIHLPVWNFHIDP